jgi:hypothetical protein
MEDRFTFYSKWIVIEMPAKIDPAPLGKPLEAEQASR